MLGTGHIQDRMTDSNEEICRLPAELSGERWLADIFNQVLAHEEPKLPGGNPDTATPAQDFRGVFGLTGHNTPTTKP